MCMPVHMTALGFPVTTEQDFRHYAYQASEFGQKIETRNGSYTHWEAGRGIELWVQTNLHRRIIGMNPHFRGEARLRADIIRRIPRYEHSILDGAFYSWADPSADHPASDLFPFVFDLPDYDVYDKLCLPCTASIQLTAFAYELKGFQHTEAYLASLPERRDGRKFAIESFIPSGLFTSSGRVQDAPLANAILSGHVLDSMQLTNPVTGQRFYWARIHIPGGDVDVVADPQVVQGHIVRDGVISGRFWLSGRLV